MRLALTGTTLNFDYWFFAKLQQIIASNDRKNRI